MKIISFDVGIKNLACCILEIENDDNFKILFWDVLNLTNPTIFPSCCQEKCKFKVKQYFYNTQDYYCTKHCKKNNNNHAIIPDDLQNLKKMQQKGLFSLAQKYELEPKKPISKKQLIEILDEYIQNHFLIPLPKEQKASEMDLISVGREMKNAFNKNVDKYGPFEYVIIENQISPIANRMKTVQGMIAYHFIMKNIESKIYFISASNKLNCFTDDKIENYSDRKKASVIISKQILEKCNQFSDYKNYLDKNGKKDDLADCFLQLLYYIKTQLKINIL